MASAFLPVAFLRPCFGGPPGLGGPLAVGGPLGFGGPLRLGGPLRVGGPVGAPPRAPAASQRCIWLCSAAAATLGGPPSARTQQCALGGPPAAKPGAPGAPGGPLPQGGPQRGGPPQGAPCGPLGLFSCSQRRLSCMHASGVRLFAPKKKKGTGGAPGGPPGGPPGAQEGGEGAKGGYDHVFNIYKEINEDHKLLEDKFYPKWLWGLHNKPKSYGELALVFLYGKGIETATAMDYLRFCRLHRKTQIQLNNARLKKSKRNSIKPIFWDV
ncbi:hypothetical protein, conserved [Eimeria necatrix]|uniref:Large ribosomal subunit protein mL54 n=1 Tax=Eimeria necatrix TaxID=51315 RepID=U6N0Z0_9EIME|nr:hypothetical protein, conserved [Eimeria necatrix]CDJ69892.1 hypothetical protein, conserved [Eimeria necatrix]